MCTAGGSAPARAIGARNRELLPIGPIPSSVKNPKEVVHQPLMMLASLPTHQAKLEVLGWLTI